MPHPPFTDQLRASSISTPYVLGKLSNFIARHEYLASFDSTEFSPCTAYFRTAGGMGAKSNQSNHVSVAESARQVSTKALRLQTNCLTNISCCCPRHTLHRRRIPFLVGRYFWRIPQPIHNGQQSPRSYLCS
jgi:hypothetical protein